MDMYAEEMLAKYRSKITPKILQHTQNLLDGVAQMDKEMIILFADLLRFTGEVNPRQHDIANACGGLLLAASGGLLQVYQAKDKEAIPTLWGDV